MRTSVLKRPLLLAVCAAGLLHPLACRSERAASDTAATPAKPENTQPTAAAPEAAAPAAPTYNRLTRAEFNNHAQELFVPLLWIDDANANGTVEPAEVAVLWQPGAARSAYLGTEGFTAQFTQAYAQMVAAKAGGDVKLTGEGPEAARRVFMLKELRQGRPTLVHTDFSRASDEDKAIVTHLMAAADLIERLHARQLGTDAMTSEIPADDTVSRAVFHRNQGPWCEAPGTEKEENCNALSRKPPRTSGIYPLDIQADKKFCETLIAPRKDLTDHFVAVIKDEKGALKPVPYQEAFKPEMEGISRELKAAASAVTTPAEAPFKAYLNAAAQAFVDNNWEPANEAWAAMGNTSKWYVRVGPDETYWEPCAIHAGFHMSFARINEGSAAWKQKLDPIKNDMEQVLAKVAGAPYKARKVDFKVPEFIDVVINAGDARPASGATIGQSLPNWGPTAEKGGRTVTMVNFYQDVDSKQALRSQAESLLCAETMKSYSSDSAPQDMSTLLHEAAHNLGPSHDYKVKGKTDDEVFGGPLASTLEELKAQTSALFFTDWLVEKKLVTQEDADKAHVRDVTWAFGHISRGMYTDDKPKPYSQLASIQVGFLMKEGAMEWKAEEMAANGQDKGCFVLKLETVSYTHLTLPTNREV